MLDFAFMLFMTILSDSSSVNWHIIILEDNTFNTCNAYKLIIQSFHSSVLQSAGVHILSGSCKSVNVT